MSVGAMAVKGGWVGLDGRPLWVAWRRWCVDSSGPAPPPSDHQGRPYGGEQYEEIMMSRSNFDPKTYTRRNSNRLPFYDYRSSGAYFITICTENRQRVLEIPLIRTAMIERWQQLPQRFPGVRLDAFVIMPDHVHGILWLDGSVKDAPTLGSVVGALKAWVTIVWRQYHREANIRCVGHLWQRDFYEHVIRNEEDLELTREYTVNNPLKALLIQEQRYEEVKRARRDGGRP